VNELHKLFDLFFGVEDSLSNLERMVRDHRRYRAMLIAVTIIMCINVVLGIVAVLLAAGVDIR